MTYSIETRECTRCYGDGRFGPAVVFGGKCFKCLGTGRIYTAAGAKVSTAYAEAQRRPVSEIFVGTRVWSESIDAGSLQIPAVAWTVESADGDEISGTDAKGDRHSNKGGTVRLVLTRGEKQAILASFAPRAGLLLDGEPTKVTKSRKTDAEKAATKLAARERNAAKREAARHADPATEKQLALIASYGFGTFRPVSKVEASQVIDRIFAKGA